MSADDAARTIRRALNNLSEIQNVSLTAARIDGMRKEGLAALDSLLAQNAALRQALAAYRSALRCREPESEQLKALGDDALISAPAAREQEGVA